MHYQTILIAIIVLMLAVASYRTVLAQPASPSTARPNVILILADDLGYNDLGVYGSPDALTPNIDALAQEGVYFRQFYAGAPACTPTRYMLLTGRDVWRAGDPGLHQALLLDDTDVGMDDAPTLAEIFQATGYATALIGKWHLGHGEMLADPPGSGATDSPYLPNHHGFDYFYGTLTGVDYNTHWVMERYLNWWENKSTIPGGEAGQYATTLLTKRAVAFIEQQAADEQPFFLYLAHIAPHRASIVNPDPFARNQLPIGEEEQRLYLARFDHIYPSDRNLRKRYLSMIAVMDDGIGEVLQALEEQGIRDDTLIIFLSDNGGDTRYGGSNTPLRGRKGQIYEGGIRVPLIVNWPGNIDGGWTSDQIAVSRDLLPTILALTNLSWQGVIDGVDLSSHLRDRALIERDLALANRIYGQIYRRGDWKYLKRPGMPPELYDLKLDPAETTNLAESQAGILRELQSRHRTWLDGLSQRKYYLPFVN
jgi:arylsulfatase A